ncbi:unnamed protein product [Caenorhabditis bovis]|nr:unnamed protein product [Caenorhabditis bovis]
MHPSSSHQAKREEIDWIMDAPMPDDEDDECLASTSAASSSRQNLQISAPHQYTMPLIPQCGKVLPPHKSSPKNVDDKADEVQLETGEGAGPSCSHVVVESDAKKQPDDDPKIIEVIPTEEEANELLMRMKKNAEPAASPRKGRHWATVFYYELTDKVGPTFFAHGDHFIVDGYASRWTPNRMSLSAIPLHGSMKSSAIRNQLGKGILVSRADDGVVTLISETTSPIFVQCPQTAEIMGEVPNMVFRLQNVPGKANQLQIFDENYFQKLLERRKNLMNEGYYMLHSHCITRISFVKGFGSDYSRAAITENPCWIEIHMNNKLDEFDKMIRSGNFVEEIGEDCEQL